MSLRRSTKRLVASGVKVGAAAFDRIVPPAPGVVVLIYHRVGGGSGSNVDLSRDVFDQQVSELVAAERVITMDAAVALLADGSSDGASFDKRCLPVVLTFDDGTADWLDVVLPVLASHQAPATFYVASDFVDAGRAFPGDGVPMSWAGLAEMQASGLATIGSHTHTHALLDRATASTAADELDRSIELIGANVGAAPRHFAYPKALLAGPDAEPEVRSRFATAAIARGVPNPVGVDLHRLTRTPIQVTDGMRWFRHKAAGGMRLEDRARQAIGGRRYAGATT
jgi:peptidoglycan/xylan/chitin deacetylase (PgdA/CDA1 family)